MSRKVKNFLMLLVRCFMTAAFLVAGLNGVLPVFTYLCAWVSAYLVGTSLAAFLHASED